MGYIVPSFKELINRVSIVKIVYQERKKNHNLFRLQLIDILEAVTYLIKDINAISTQHQKELAEFLVGAYIFCLESVSSKYKVFNPNYAEGYLFSSGSILYKLLLYQLEINQTNPINDMEKLIYLSKLHHFLFKKDQHCFQYYLDRDSLSLDIVKQQIECIMQSVFNRVATSADKLIKAIPTEEVIDRKMAKMLEDYLAKTSSNNPKRIFLAHLVAFVTLALATESYATTIVCGKYFLNRTKRIKIGLFLYIIQSIKDTYSLRSPRNHSALYDLCCEALNVDNPNDIDDVTKLACLTAFDSFITDRQILNMLENKLHQPVDVNIYQIRQQLSTMIEMIMSSQSNISLSSMTIGAATLGALILAQPGYGLGYAIGYGLSQTNMLMEPKISLGKVTSYAMKIFLGNAGNYLGNFGANIILDATLERAFGKLFEVLGVLIGAATGGVIGLIIFDLSYKTLTQLGSLYMFLYPMLSPNSIDHADRKFVECLLTLPPDIFSEEKKDKLRNIIDIGFFRQNNSASSALIQEKENILQL